MKFISFIFYMCLTKLMIKYIVSLETSKGGASVRRITYSWWNPNLVIPSKESVVSLGAEIMRLGLSVGKQKFEP